MGKAAGQKVKRTPLKRKSPIRQRKKIVSKSKKKKPGRLYGDDLRELNDLIWERDGGCCVLCGAPVPRGTKFHHILFKSHGGTDDEKNGVTLCQAGRNCHTTRAHGPEAKEVRKTLEKYISDTYFIT